MPSPAEAQDLDNRVDLLVGGVFHSGWMSYEIDSDLLTPADAWNMRLSLDGGRLPDAVISGAPVQIQVGGELAMTGRIDEITSTCSKGRLDLTMCGRDLAGQLTDCAAPIFTVQQVSLAQVVKRFVNPFGIDKIRISAENAHTREKVSVEPRDRVWDALARAAEANGLWPWFDPDGTLVVGGPDYSTPPVATLTLRLPPNAQDNNVLAFELHDSTADSYSEVTVLGQCSGGGYYRQANNAIRGAWKDPSVPFYRPLIVVDHEVENTQQAIDRAQKLVMDSRLKRWTLGARLPGHRINAPGMPGHGQLWQPGTRVNVIDEQNKLQCVCFVMARRFTGGRDQAPMTALTLKEDGAWIIAAHPHKKLSRRLNGASGAIFDISNVPAPSKS